jgi:hypothetical protein
VLVAVGGAGALVHAGDLVLLQNGVILSVEVTKARSAIGEQEAEWPQLSAAALSASDVSDSSKRLDVLCKHFACFLYRL